MTSTSDSVTGPNKQRRMKGSQSMDGRTATATSAAITTTTATATADPWQLIVTSLEPIMEVIVSQPESLQTYVISSCGKMLDLIDTIIQRSTNHTRFEKPMANAKTGEVLNDGAGKLG